MSAKKSQVLSQDEINTYLHRRLARLERSAGLKVHPHPDEFDRELSAAEEAAAKLDAARAETVKAEIAAAAEKEKAIADANAEADSNADLTAR